MRIGSYNAIRPIIEITNDLLNVAQSIQTLDSSTIIVSDLRWLNYAQ